MIASDKRYSRRPLSTPETRDGADTEPEERRYERTTLEEGTVLAGRYKLHGLIGEGGMGDVYLATHLKIDKKVAVKVLAPEQMRRTRTVNRFLQEAKAASKIRHPNVVDITDYGEAEGCAFFVMEYLEGEDLSQMLKRIGRIEWERAKRIATQLLEALSAAHKAGIIHRDIKPHNCFITPTDRERDFVKVIDFGIAKLREGTGEQLTRTGTIVGTAEYMSPEQGLGQELDGRSDLYSVGIILFRMLTGEVPFKAANPMGVLYHHIHSDVLPPARPAPKRASAHKSTRWLPGRWPRIARRGSQTLQHSSTPSKPSTTRPGLARRDPRPAPCASPPSRSRPSPCWAPSAGSSSTPKTPSRRRNRPNCDVPPPQPGRWGRRRAKGDRGGEAPRGGDGDADGEGAGEADGEGAGEADGEGAGEADAEGAGQAEGEGETVPGGGRRPCAGRYPTRRGA